MGKWMSLAAGSLAGGFARYFVSGAVHRLAGAEFPYGTLAVNLGGCLIIGFLDGLAEVKFLLGPDARMLLMVGFCGALTTFSTLIFETSNLVKSGEFARAAANVLVSVVLGLVLFRLGQILAEVV